jgi:hypothetical protein
MESRAIEAGGPHDLGQRAGLLAGRLAAGVGLRRSDHQAMQPEHGAGSAGATGPYEWGQRGSLLAGQLAAGVGLIRSDRQAVEPEHGVGFLASKASYTSKYPSYVGPSQWCLDIILTIFGAPVDGSGPKHGPR